MTYPPPPAPQQGPHSTLKWPGPPPPPEPRRRPWLVVGIVAAVLVTLCCVGGVIGAVVWRANDSSGDPAAAGTPEWRVGGCVRQEGGPTDIPPSLSPEKRQALESTRRFEPVDCEDDRAVSKVVQIIPASGVGEKAAAARCPGTTDDVYTVRPLAGVAGRVACARRLKAPHPGDAGGGGGALIFGDCVVVSSTSGFTVRNDWVAEIPCRLEGWFAAVLGVAPSARPAAASCPAGTLSRVLDPAKPGSTLCLGRDRAGKGQIARPGDCVQLPENARYTTTRVPCSSAAIHFRLSRFATAAGRCGPGDSRPQQVTGYDRKLCGQYEINGRRVR